MKWCSTCLKEVLITGTTTDTPKMNQNMIERYYVYKLKYIFRSFFAKIPDVKLIP